MCFVNEGISSIYKGGKALGLRVELESEKSQNNLNLGGNRHLDPILHLCFVLSFEYFDSFELIFRTFFWLRSPNLVS